MTRQWVVLLILAVFAFGLIGGRAAAGDSSDCQDTGLLRARVDGNNEFAFDLYKKISGDDANFVRNVFFSPYSISTALGMTFAGARNETAAQMAAVLHFDPDQSTLHQSFFDLATGIDGTGKAYQLAVGNALWGQENYPFDREYVALIRQYYSGGFHTVDFARETETSRGRINQWIAEKTADKIRNLLQQGDINALTRLVLTNAIYFKGDWETQFDRRLTRPAPFRVKPGQTIDVPMMSRTGSLPYAATDLLQAVELPYAGGDLSMLVLLPTTDLNVVERQLSGQLLDELLVQMKPVPLSLYLPRFKFDARYALQEEKYLPALGMVDAFQERLADFSGLTGRKELFISGVFHKAFIDVNESGTEAAAATAVVIGLKSALPPTTVFRADRPFMFLIRHKPTGAILFLGRVANPAQ